MDSFELNKIMGAVLGTLLFVMGAGFVAEAIYHPIENRGPGYALPEPEVSEGGAVAEAAPEVPLGILLASASAERGANAAKKCQSCHNFGEGEPNKQGPHLYDVVLRAEGAVPDFAYSDILLQHNAEGRVWTYENLDHFLTRPADYAPGTKMNFAGVRTPEERADILAYMQTLSADPKPFPPPEETVPNPLPDVPPDPTAAPADVVPEPAENVVAPEGVIAPAPADQPVADPAQPAAVTDTPVVTQQETQVQGTPTSGPGGSPPPEEQVDAPPPAAPGAAPSSGTPTTTTPAPASP
ncbi:MAG: cytochrome c family protein [Devosia sp.]|nr:cytochrome c family protein [Devosia sp.]